MGNERIDDLLKDLKGKFSITFDRVSYDYNLLQENAMRALKEAYGRNLKKAVGGEQEAINPEEIPKVVVEFEPREIYVGATGRSGNKYEINLDLENNTREIIDDDREELEQILEDNNFNEA